MVRILTSVMAVWVISTLPVFNSLDASSLLITAFLVGVFPESGLALIQDAIRRVALGRVFPSLQEKHPITDLEGINLYDRVRLLEERIFQGTGQVQDFCVK